MHAFEKTSNAVLTCKILTNAVLTCEILTNAVLTCKILTNAVFTCKILTNAVLTCEILRNAVLTGKILSKVDDFAKLVSQSLAIEVTVDGKVLVTPSPMDSQVRFGVVRKRFRAMCSRCRR